MDTKKFRRVLGHFCTGLTVVTSTTDAGPVGFTCQSFSSLSLDPPLIVLCPAKSSTTWPEIRRSGRFCVNILADHQETLSSRFAVSGGAKFAGVEFGASPNGSPLLPDALAWLDCTLNAEYDGGDHSIAIGRVHDLDAAPGARPLLFHRGQYARAVER
ncbi:flavin reductase family protein [Streptomyces sp. T028]|uniref:flavin reductase family protein n=1 Tax=Streptomyces sp. T028 TaxID=3394379 RepID=UPI003A8638DC